MSKTSLPKAESYSWRLVLITGGSVLGTVVPGLFGAGPTEALFGSILVGLLSAFFTGERPVTRVKALAALALTLIAVILTVGGFTLADLVHGRSVLGDGPYTFPSLSVVKNPYRFAGLADYDRDGNVDIVARDNATGLLWLYPGNGTRGQPGSRVQISDGWNGLTFAGLADYDNDGNVDIVASENTTGLLWLYPGNGTRGQPDQRVQIGNGWKGYTFAGLADYDHDGNVDIVAIENATRLLLLYPGRGIRDHPGSKVRIDSDWKGYTFAGLADYDHDGNVDIVAREDATSLLLLYPGNGTRSRPDPSMQIGKNW